MNSNQANAIYRALLHLEAIGADCAFDISFGSISYTHGGALLVTKAGSGTRKPLEPKYESVLYESLNAFAEAHNMSQPMPVSEKAGKVVAFRIVGRHGPYSWVDGKPDPEPEFIVGEGERIELAYAYPLPVSVPAEMGPEDDPKGARYRRAPERIAYRRGWNACREFMLVAAPGVS